MAEIKTRLVLRNDTLANWELANPVLLKGEVGIAIDVNKLKIGDGVKHWNELDYFGGEMPEIPVESIYVVEIEKGVEHLGAIATEVGSNVLKKGDMAIVREVINGDKKQYTSYVYDGSNWEAMDGNYSADNVYFSDKLTLTQAFGKYTPDETTGSVDIAAEGMSLKGLLLDAFSEEKDPSATEPAVSFSSVAQGSYEVGTNITKTSYSASLSAGSYTYGPATGITADSWEVSVADLGKDNLTTASGDFGGFQVIDNMSGYAKITAKATYGDGAMPVTNLGNAYPDAQIKAGSKSKTSSGITAYRAWFHGYKAGGSTLDVATIDSDDIRGLTSKNGSFTASLKTTNMQQIFFAAPAGAVKSVSVSHSVNGAPQTVNKKTVYVKGANSYVTEAEPNGMAYDLYYVSNDNPNDGDATYTIAITK